MPPEPGTIKAILETLIKPFTLIFNPVAERIGNRLKRKPKLYFNIHPVGSIWCYAWNGAKPMMQVRFDADITNDGDEGVMLLDGYVKGTKSKLPFMRKMKIPPRTLTTDEIIVVFVEPIVGEGGKDFTGKIVFVDQLKRKHYTDKTTFTWVGTTEPPGAPTPPSSPK